MKKIISIDYLSNIDLKTAKIISAERIKGSDKLLKLELDVGKDGERHIVAGIGKKYEPEFLIGKTIIIVANLEPKTLMGIESQGMLLAASDDDGNLSLLTTLDDINCGSSIK